MCVIKMTKNEIRINVFKIIYKICNIIFGYCHNILKANTVERQFHELIMILYIC